MIDKKIVDEAWRRLEEGVPPFKTAQELGVGLRELRTLLAAEHGKDELNKLVRAAMNKGFADRLERLVGNLLADGDITAERVDEAVSALERHLSILKETKNGMLR